MGVVARFINKLHQDTYLDWNFYQQLFKMLRRLCTVSLLSFTLLAAAKAESFENTAIVRTIELGGSLVHVTTTFAVKALEAGTKVYTVALGDAEKQKTSWLEAKVKGQAKPLTVLERAADSTKYVHPILTHPGS